MANDDNNRYEVYIEDILDGMDLMDLHDFDIEAEYQVNAVLHGEEIAGKIRMKRLSDREFMDSLGDLDD